MSPVDGVGDVEPVPLLGRAGPREREAVAGRLVVAGPGEDADDVAVVPVAAAAGGAAGLVGDGAAGVDDGDVEVVVRH